MLSGSAAMALGARRSMASATRRAGAPRIQRYGKPGATRQRGAVQPISSSSSMKPTMTSSPRRQKPGSLASRPNGLQQIAMPQRAAGAQHLEVLVLKSGVALAVDLIERVHQAIAERIGVDVERRVDEVRDVGPEVPVLVVEAEHRAEALALHREPDLARGARPTVRPCGAPRARAARTRGRRSAEPPCSACSRPCRRAAGDAGRRPSADPAARGRPASRRTPRRSRPASAACPPSASPAPPPAPDGRRDPVRARASSRRAAGRRSSSARRDAPRAPPDGRRRRSPCRGAAARRSTGVRRSARRSPTSSDRSGRRHRARCPAPRPSE